MEIDKKHPLEEKAFGIRQWIGVIFLPIIIIGIIFFPPPEGLSIEAWRTAGIGATMAVLWLTEALPVYVTALLPLLLFPLLEVQDIKTTAAPYANPLIFLFMGGFIISLAMQRWNLHRRVALSILNAVGTSPSLIIAGFMVATAFLSMWISNTATVLMMFPIALSVVTLIGEEVPDSDSSIDFKNFSTGLLLSIAYAGTIGGIGTLIGTPPNVLMAGFLEENYQIDIGFAQWMLVGIPIVLISLPLAHFILTRVCFPVKQSVIPDINHIIKEELASLGPVKYAEKIVMFAATCTGILWISRPYLNKFFPLLSDPAIAMLGGVILFFIPVSIKKGVFVMSWDQAKLMPWGVFILFGGGLSLAFAIQETGLALYLSGLGAKFASWPLFVLVIFITLIIRFLTELTSNTATVSTFLPVVAALSVGLGYSPLVLVVPTVLAGCLAFMLPVATPPNAIVFSSGRITLPQMATAGALVTLVFIILIPAVLFTLVPLVFDIALN